MVGTSCNGVAAGCAAEHFFSDFSYGPVAWGAAVRAGWTETPGLPLPGASLVAAALDAAVATGAAELGVRFGARDDTLVLAMFCAATVVVASDESAWAGAASSIAELEVGARSPAVGSPGLQLLGLELSGLELPTLDSLDLGPAGCLAFAGCVTGAGLMSRTGNCSVAIGAAVGAEDVGEIELPTLESLASSAGGPFPFTASVTGARLVSRTEDCSVGIGVGAGAEDVGDKVLKAELVAATGLGL